MALAPGGSIVLVGDEQTPNGAVGAVVRLTAEGVPDSMFGSRERMVVLPRIADAKGRVLSALDYRGVAVARNGSIHCAGVGRVSNELFVARDGLLARLNRSGDLESGFGREGQVMVEQPGFQTIDSFEPNTLMLAGDGGVLVGGASCGGFGPCYADLNAFTASGSPTRLANQNGGCSPPYCQQSVMLTPLPGGGWLGGAWEGELLLDRLEPSFNLVSSFGTSETGSDLDDPGLALAQLPAGSQTSGNMLVLPNGRIVVAGSLPATGAGSAMFVAQLLGLGPAPRPRVSVVTRRLQAWRGALSALLECHHYVSCRGQAVLRVRSSGSGRRAVLAAGPFDIAPDGTGVVVMPITAAGERILRRSRLTAGTLKLSLAGASTVAVRVLVPRPPKRSHHIPPGAAGALEPFASDVAAFESDDNRYVLYTQGSALHVLDTRTQREYSAHVHAGCTITAQRALSFPMALLSCEEPAENVDQLIDMLNGRVQKLPGPSYQYDWGNIGQIWVGPHQAGECPNFHVCQEYLDWHTGAVRRIDTPPAPQPVMGALNEVIARNLAATGLEPVAACPPFEPSNLEEQPGRIPGAVCAAVPALWTSGQPRERESAELRTICAARSRAGTLRVRNADPARCDRGPRQPRVQPAGRSDRRGHRHLV